MIAVNASLSQTPHSNTGSTRQEPHEKGLSARVDFMTFTGNADIEELCRAIWSTFGTNFDFEGAKPGTRGRYYSTILKSSQGIELAYVGESGQKHLYNFRLSIPGSPLGHVSQHHTNELCRYLHRIGANCTRFDWCIDDYDRQLSMSDILGALEQSNYSGAKSWSNYRSGKRGGQRVGWTVYVGSPMSDKRVRIYDKEIESKGKTKTIRFEAQWRGELAKSAFEAFLSLGMGELRDTRLSELAVGTVSFVVRSNEVLSRCETFPWWAEFVARVGVPSKMPKRTMQVLISDKIHWIEHQVSSTLAMISSIKGFDDTMNWLERITRDKLGKLSGMQNSLIQTFRDRLQVERDSFNTWMAISDWDVL